MRTFALLWLALPAAAVADLQATSRIDAVTVYQSSARVVRTARVEAPAGDTRLLLRGLPDGLVDDSVRVHGGGTARARVHGISVERITAEVAPSAEVRAAEERLEKLSDEDRSLEDREKGARSRREFVESLRSTYSEERAKNLAVRGVSAREWAEMASFVAREQQAAAEEVRRTAAARRDLGRKIQAARADLQKLQSKRGETTKTVAVELSAERAGTLEVEVSYLVPQAGWRPVWDARLSPEKGTVELSLHGSVEQHSGEDWSQVKLALSTAQPGRGLQIPELQPRWLEKPRPPPPQPVPRKAAELRAPAAQAVVARPEAADEGFERKRELEEAPAQLAEGLLSAVFTAPRRETVDGAGRARKVFLVSLALQSELSRVAVPRADASAYLAAKAVNGTGAPLLPGPASVFLGDEFVGRAQLPLVPLGGELKLAFGADDRVKVERQVVERRHETSGLFTKDDVIRYRVRTTVKNLWSKPVAVRLMDLVPVSREEQVKVAILDGTTAPAEPDDPMKPGVKAWLITLDPQKEKVVELRYEVRFPRGMEVAGLE
ncbi:MAG TPA: mucoidy inhibitor MuiA family protein [Anaeromyxobacteraceae bacterium]|nr:mucoidy inhibitor MuiA family protein [Anaeromyxobacteraceae bacterium]